MKKLNLIFILFFTSFGAFSQVKPIYFIGDNITTDKNRATSYAVYGKLSDQNIWMFKRYDLYDNLLQTGSYHDELLSIPHGKFVFYMDLQEFNYTNKTKYKLKNKTRFINQEVNFTDGKEDGQWLTFYPDGNLFNVQNYVEGKLEGEYILYDIYGNFIIKGNYFNEQKHGEWLTEKGTVKEVYDNGVLKSTIHLKKTQTPNSKN